MRIQRGVIPVLASATLFGASTPLARALVGDIDPLWLAGLLYAGSGLGLSLLLLMRHAGMAGAHRRVTGVARGDLPWLAFSIVAGGIVAPVLFTYGLRGTPGATASLLLNLETALTVVIAWFVFREHRNSRVVAGMVLIVAAGFLLAGGEDGVGGRVVGGGALLIALACLCWALDNNSTRRVAGNDAMLIAAAKGIAGGTVNIGLAVLLAGPAPPLAGAMAAAGVGFGGYGVSLVLFVIALRELGTARASAYYGIAPFVGVVVAFVVLGERPDAVFGVAAALMALGVWLHLTERHGHMHAHDALAHTHSHTHDLHHRHEHAFAWDGKEPHTHPHVHDALTHSHPHAPDLHHRHEHD
jgi:drug/metabolite transporter (DMT)-like permease